LIRSTASRRDDAHAPLSVSMKSRGTASVANACETHPPRALADGVRREPRDSSSCDRWAAIPRLEGREPRQPDEYPSGPARFVFFGASSCRPGRASMLSDVALAAGLEGRVPVGLAIDSEDEDGFARSPVAYRFSGVPVCARESTARSRLRLDRARGRPRRARSRSARDAK
jgi:hypothetical protein